MPCRRAMRRQQRRIENQHDAAVAQIGRARYAIDADQRIANRPHDDLPLSDDAVDREPERSHACRPRRREAGRAGARGDPEQPRPAARWAAPPAGYGTISRCSTCRNERRIDLEHLAHRATAAPRRSRSPTRAISASAIASVSGSSIVNRVPWPGRGLERQRAGQLLHRCLDDRHADTAAARPIGLVARGKARRADQRATGWRLTAGPATRAGRRARARLRARASTSMPAPSSAISIATRSPTVAALRMMVPSRRLAGGDARSAGVSMPWLTALRTRWRTGIHHPLDQVLVDLGVLPVAARDATRRAELARQIAHDKRHAAGRPRRPARGARA